MQVHTNLDLQCLRLLDDVQEGQKIMTGSRAGPCAER